MAPRRLIAAILSLVLLAGCSTTRVVRLDTGQGEPLEYRPPISNKPVKVDAEAFEQALAQLVLEAPLTLRPPQQGWLVRASYPSNDAGTRWQRLMSKSFGGLCEPGQRRPDCLSLLDDAAGMTEWDKLGVALGLSLEPLKASISKAVEKTLAPQLFYTVIATGLIGWAVLAANPEPVFTKAAAVVSAILLICLGVETFLELVDASREMKRATDKATTWEELEQAGQRFANRVGPEVARVFVLAVTVLVCHGMNGGAAWLASRLAMLPSFSELAAVGASRFGISLANVGQVRAVAVSAEGTITIALAPTAMAMTGQGMSGSGGPRPKGSLTGRPTRPEPNDKVPENIRAIQRENESARTLADNGYPVEQNPPARPNGTNPDYKINGEYYDCYAPSTPSARNIADRIERFKVQTGQADRIILNLDDTSIAIDAMKKQLVDWPIEGLKEVIVVKGGKVIPLFP